MQIFVQFIAFDTITAVQDVVNLRRLASEQFGRLKESRKLVSSGIFCDARGGYLVLDVQDSAEVLDLLGSGIVDHFHITTHPLVSLEQIGEFFRKSPPK